jgi:polysaccharide export outer membrane protein
MLTTQQEARSAMAAAPSRAGTPYILRTNDQLRVQVYNEPTITGEYAIDSSGSLSVPGAGRVRAAGLTAEQLERRLTQKLNSGILKDARVNIQVLTYAPFYILGEVKKPGEFPYKPGMSVADAVALAGGFTYRADESKAFVRHSDARAEVMHRLDANPPVSPGDNIRIPERFL